MTEDRDVQAEASDRSVGRARRVARGAWRPAAKGTSGSRSTAAARSVRSVQPRDRTVRTLAPGLPQHRGEQGHGSLLVQRLVAVAALGRLNAGRTPASAGTQTDRLERRLQQPRLRLVAALGD